MGLLSGSVIKNLLAMQKTQEAGVPSLGWEDPLEKGMVTHSSILAWRIPWTEGPGGLQSIGLQRMGHDQADEHVLINFTPKLYLGSFSNGLRIKRP